MFAYLKGTLEYKGSDSIIIDVNGVGYRVYTPLTALEPGCAVGSQIKVYTYFYVREDTQALYGFLSMEELKMFEQLLSVSGVGPKAALSLVSNITPSQFGLAVLTDDADSFTKAPGIGKKTAQRIILELKDKMKKEQKDMPEFNVAAAQKASADNNSFAEATAALVMLGYSSQEAHRAVSSVYSRDKSVEQIVKDALKQIIS